MITTRAKLMEQLIEEKVFHHLVILIESPASCKLAVDECSTASVVFSSGLSACCRAIPELHLQLRQTKCFQTNSETQEKFKLIACPMKACSRRKKRRTLKDFTDFEKTCKRICKILKKRQSHQKRPTMNILNFQ